MNAALLTLDFLSFKTCPPFAPSPPPPASLRPSSLPFHLSASLPGPCQIFILNFVNFSPYIHTGPPSATAPSRPSRPSPLPFLAVAALCPPSLSLASPPSPCFLISSIRSPHQPRRSLHPRQTLSLHSLICIKPRSHQGL